MDNVIFYQVLMSSNISGQVWKNNKNPHQESFLYSKKMELSNSNTKKLLIFSEKKAVLIFQETEKPKNPILILS